VKSEKEGQNSEIFVMFIPARNEMGVFDKGGGDQSTRGWLCSLRRSINTCKAYS